MNKKIRINAKTISFVFVFLLLYISVPFIVAALVPFFDGTRLGLMGQLGDTYGTFNSFFTCLSVIILAVSFHYQRQSFDLQREELSLQRLDIQEQSKIFTEQAKQGKMNNDISILFSLLSRITQSVSSLRSRTDRMRWAMRNSDNDEYVYGEDAIKIHAKNSKQLLINTEKPSPGITDFYMKFYYPILKDIVIASKIADDHDRLKEIVLNTLPNGTKDIYINLMNSAYEFEGRSKVVSEFNKLPDWISNELS